MSETTETTDTSDGREPLSAEWCAAHFDHLHPGVGPNLQETLATLRAGCFHGLVDLTAELPAPTGTWAHAGLPWLDLIAPTASQLDAAARHIARLQPGGPVLVACALGYSRSASAVAAWLILPRRAASVDEAAAILQRARPQVVLGPAHRQGPRQPSRPLRK